MAESSAQGAQRGTKRPASPTQPKSQKLAKKLGAIEQVEKELANYMRLYQLPETDFKDELIDRQGKDHHVGSALFEPSPCAVIITTSNASSIMDTGVLRDQHKTGKAWVKARLSIDSQNPTMDLSFGFWAPPKPPMNTGIAPVTVHTSIIGTENLLNVKYAKHKFVQDLAPRYLRDCVNNILRAEGAADQALVTKKHDSKLAEIIKAFNVKSRTIGFEIFVLKITKNSQQSVFASCDSAAIQTASDLGFDLPYVASFKLFRSAEFITVIRSGVDPINHFAAKHWLALMDKCQRDGIYWGYRININSRTSRDVIVDMLNGNTQAPVLPWMKNVAGEIGKHAFRPMFTSMKDWALTMIIGLVHDNAYANLISEKHFAKTPDAPVHHVQIFRAAEQPHFLLHVHITKATGIERPQPVAGSQFRVTFVADSEQLVDDVEAVSFDAIVNDEQVDDVDFVLKAKNLDYGWPGGLTNGTEYSVQLSETTSAASAIRELDAIFHVYADQDAPAYRRDFLLGRTRRQASRLDLTSAFNALQSESADVYRLFIDWLNTTNVNQLQESAVDSLGHSMITLVIGPPGTGKSTLISVAAIKFAVLGKCCVISSPTNAAAQSNTQSLLRMLSVMNAALQTRVTPVLLTSMSIAHQQIFEIKGISGHFVKPLAGESCLTALYGKALLSRRILDFCEAQSPHRIRGHGKLDVLFNAISVLQQSPSAEVTMQALAEFKDAFQACMLMFFSETRSGLVFVSTINMASMLSKYDMKYDVGMVDEACLAQATSLPIVLQLNCDAYILVGDPKQMKPVITSRKHNAMFKQMELSTMARVLTYTDAGRIELGIEYRFNKELAMIVSSTAGYSGLASIVDRNSQILRIVTDSFNAPNFRGQRTIIADSEFARLNAESQKGLKRHFTIIDVQALSATEPRTSSSINYAAVFQEQQVFQWLVNAGVKAEDFLSVTGYAAQLEAKQKFHKLVNPNTDFRCTTTGKVQGLEEKVVLVDYCMARNDGELGMMQEWNRGNVMISRGKEAVILFINVTLYRSKMSVVYKNSPELARLLVRALDQGAVFTLNIANPGALPADKSEASAMTAAGPDTSRWSRRQPISATDRRASDKIFGAPRRTEFNELELTILTEQKEIEVRQATMSAKILTNETSWKANRKHQQVQNLTISSLLQSSVHSGSIQLVNNARAQAPTPVAVNPADVPLPGSGSDDDINWDDDELPDMSRQLNLGLAKTVDTQAEDSDMAGMDEHADTAMAAGKVPPADKNVEAKDVALPNEEMEDLDELEDNGEVDMPNDTDELSIVEMTWDLWRDEAAPGQESAA
jgi:hypothetical protein